MMILNQATIQKCIIWACEQEVLAPKPGNVNVYNDGHNMQVADFINSAQAIAPALTLNNATVGERILAAIKATRAVVDCNTNLGIVLLFAPLCVAIEKCTTFEQLSDQLEKTLQNLTIKDAEYCYQAIQLADAGGLGNVAEHDVHSRVTVTLLQAMSSAKHRDTIAAQYLNNYLDIRTIGFANLTSAINCGERVEWATTFAYLTLLSNIPDTLIFRKQGSEIANIVSDKARYFIAKSNSNKDLKPFEAELVLWDKELKKDAINPGTTADLTATVLLLRAFEQAFLQTEF